MKNKKFTIHGRYIANYGSLKGTSPAGKAVRTLSWGIQQERVSDDGDWSNTYIREGHRIALSVEWGYKSEGVYFDNLEDIKRLGEFLLEFYDKEVTGLELRGATSSG